MFKPISYALRTERTYCDWILRFIRFHGAKKHPKHMGKTEIEAFLSHLAVNRNVAASTQRRALNAIIFLYRHVLDKPVEDKLEPIRAKRHRRPPVVFIRKDARRIFCNILIKFRSLVRSGNLTVRSRARFIPAYPKPRGHSRLPQCQKGSHSIHHGKALKTGCGRLANLLVRRTNRLCL
ncbi:MAG: hypothetical protein GY850_28510 [bacterium]|nr:hypothetical protein [bacterium]